MFPLSNLLTRFVQKGTLTVTDAKGQMHVFGGKAPGPSVKMQLGDEALYKRLFFSPELAAGEGYMDGSLTFKDSSLRDFLGLYALNSDALVSGPFHRALGVAARRLKRFQQSNPLGKAQQHIQHHYDIGNQLYKLFLDAGMFYSCAYFENDDDTLEAAQRAKCRLIAAKLGHERGIEDGYRTVFNVGPKSGQSVFHLHLHLLGGRDLTWPPG